LGGLSIPSTNNSTKLLQLSRVEALNQSPDPNTQVVPPQ